MTQNFISGEIFHSFTKKKPKGYSLENQKGTITHQVFHILDDTKYLCTGAFLAHSGAKTIIDDMVVDTGEDELVLPDILDLRVFVPMDISNGILAEKIAKTLGQTHSLVQYNSHYYLRFKTDGDVIASDEGEKIKAQEKLNKHVTRVMKDIKKLFMKYGKEKVEKQKEKKTNIEAT